MVYRGAWRINGIAQGHTTENSIEARLEPPTNLLIVIREAYPLDHWVLPTWVDISDGRTFLCLQSRVPNASSECKFRIQVPHSVGQSSMFNGRFEEVI